MRLLGVLGAAAPVGTGVEAASIGEGEPVAATCGSPVWRSWCRLSAARSAAIAGHRGAGAHRTWAARAWGVPPAAVGPRLTQRQRRLAETTSYNMVVSTAVKI
eukprot:SAG11_NODE_24_length_24699_cov_10.132195_17_plen_103_part_00